MRQYSDVVIVGAGASGLLCGGILSNTGIPVTILEKNQIAGKKLAATGNGRCNYTNLNMDTERYYGDVRWLGKLLSVYSPEKIIHQFQQAGVYHREKEGYVYPYTNQASTVTDALRDYCKHGLAEIVTDCKVSSVSPIKNQSGYTVYTAQGEIRCHYLVLATGGSASPELGGSGIGYKLARSLGHTIHRTYPALTGLVCGGDWWKEVAGTRVQGRFSLCIDGKFMMGECGEIQIVKEGVSGIPVFQLCREAAAALDRKRLVEGVIDFIPPMEKEELCQWLSSYGRNGLVPKKWIPVFHRFPDSWKALKEFTFPVHKTFGMERAQVTMGGVPTEEVSVDTMESKMSPNAYLTGELIDIDGKCGGYNLHFAWSCAMAAAKAIQQRRKGDHYATDIPV